LNTFNFQPSNTLHRNFSHLLCWWDDDDDIESVVNNMKNQSNKSLCSWDLKTSKRSNTVVVSLCHDVNEILPWKFSMKNHKVKLNRLNAWSNDSMKTSAWIIIVKDSSFIFHSQTFCHKNEEFNYLQVGLYVFPMMIYKMNLRRKNGENF
jgi:hypothetical protein